MLKFDIVHQSSTNPLTIPEGTSSIRTCVTSPPYWGLRDYGSEEQLGQESDYRDYIKNLVAVFDNVRDVLENDGTVWVNIGDTYVGTGHKGDWKDPKNPKGRNGQSIALNNKVEGMKSKDMMGIPWRFAIAMQDAGWYLRSDVIWEKPNAMPSPVADRPVSSYEHVFLFAKNKKYYYNYEAVQEERLDGKGFRRQRDVWRINTVPFKGAHFAVFPEELVNRCILASSEKGDTVLDPFSGSGTTGIASLKSGRHYVGIEANIDYVKMSQERIQNTLNEIKSPPLQLFDN